MFFISPIKALYSIKFYLQTLKKPLWRAFLFITYLFILSAIFLSVYVPVKLRPIINTGLEEVANIIPEITVEKGQISVNDGERLVLDNKELQGYKIIFDTSSTEPGYPTQMEKENIIMYVNKNTVYVAYNGQFQENTLQDNVNLKISKEILLENRDKIVAAINYFMVVVFVLGMLFRIIMLTLLALLVAFLISTISKMNFGFKELLTLALYLQAPIVIIDLLLLLLPVQILGMSVVIALLIFVIYTNLIFAALRNKNLPKQFENKTQEGA